MRRWLAISVQSLAKRLPAKKSVAKNARACQRASFRPELEHLETRVLPSVATPTNIVANPQGSSGPIGLTPSQISNAYGFNLSNYSGDSATGQGQTIAIIDAYNDPNIQSDLTAFDNQFSLPNPPSFSIVNQNGGTTLPPPPPPSPPGSATWTQEISLDVEWAHALAPQANILLVEANSNNLSDLFQAASYAAAQPGVSVVSMSWGTPEFSGETSDDSVFTTPSGHQGVTFVESSGDSGAPGNWVSPNVVAAGGTTLTIDHNNNYVSETGWGGSGGGISQYESKPSYQSQVTQSSTQRTTPDIAFDADPSSGVAVYDSLDFGASTPWNAIGGTSFSAPAWGALIATADQARAFRGEGSLDGPSQTLPLLYSMPTSAFHDITSGFNGYYAGTGYDLVTGLGSPIANQVVNGFVTFQTPSLPFSDNFAATSDGQLSTNWLDQVGDYTVNNSNQAVANASLNLAVLYGVSQANVKVSATVSNMASGAGADLVARYSGQGDNNYYIGYVLNTGSGYSAGIYKNVNGAFTQLASQSLTSAQFNGSGTLEFEAYGTQLQLLVNGSLVASATDGSLSSGSVGIRSSAGVTFSSFNADILTSPMLPSTVNNSNQAVASNTATNLAVLNAVSVVNAAVGTEPEVFIDGELLVSISDSSIKTSDSSEPLTELDGRGKFR
jgi:subtilase family serine protease